MLYRTKFVCAVLVVATGCGEAADSGANPVDPSANVSCDGDVCVLSGVLTDDLRLTADKEWVLSGGVFVGDDVSQTVLTVEPGTTIYGDTSTLSFLTIRRGSKLIADGTAEAPIVFTSAKNPGSRARGDWGGIIINGRAPVNNCGTPGDCQAEGEGGTGAYGGTDPADNSGVLRYVRVEFAGSLISPDNELNGIAFQGVGRGTTVEYVQSHMSKDDAIEFFGGTVDARYLVITGAADDSLDWTDGWNGRVQFAVIQKYDDNGDNGIEADNNADLHSATPRSKPTLANFTIIGNPAAPTVKNGLLLRRGTAGNLSNFIITGFPRGCIDIDDQETFTNAARASGDQLSGELTITHSIVSCDVDFVADDSFDPPFTVERFFLELNPGNSVADPLLVDPFNLSAPNFAPGANSPARSGANPNLGSFFTQVDFIGAVGPDNDWTAGWTNFDRN